MREYQQYIGGQWTTADRLFDDLDPYRGTVMARVAAGTRADAGRAVDAAAGAFPGWAELPPAQKQALFRVDLHERAQGPHRAPRTPWPTSPNSSGLPPGTALAPTPSERGTRRFVAGYGNGMAFCGQLVPTGGSLPVSRYLTSSLVAQVLGLSYSVWP